MPLNVTETERLTQAALDLALKLRLEQRIIRELRELFREMVDDMRLSIEVTGNPPNAQLYSEDIMGIMSRHSRRVSAAFSDRVAAFLSDALDQINEGTAEIEEVDENSLVVLLILSRARGTTVSALIDKLRADTRLAVQQFNAQQSAADTAIITRTNQKEMDLAVAKATAQFAEEGVTPTRAQVAETSSRSFLDRSFNRINTIAATFTQKIAENTKDVERENFYDLVNGFDAMALGLEPIAEIVIWQTEEDDRVRNGPVYNHVNANQQVRRNGFFTVSGEQLRIPGDPNGSLKNIIRCRCDAITVIE